MLNGSQWLGVLERLALVDDRDTLARLAVESAREELGLERCSLWLLVGNIRRGTWGTDLHGQTTDERHLSATLGEWPGSLIASGEAWGVDYRPRRADESTPDAVSAWTAATPLRCGDRVVGVFYNDRAISGQPHDADQQQRLAAYIGVVAQLLDRLRQTEQASRLARLAVRLTALGDIDSVVRAVAEETQSLFEWDQFGVGCITDDGLHLEQIGVAADGTCRPGVLVSMADLPSSMAPVLRGQAVLLDQPSPEDLHPDCLVAETRACMYAPMMARGQVLGVLSLATDLAGRYSHVESELLGAVASIVAPTLDRIRESDRANAASAEYAALVLAIPDLIIVYDQEARCVAIPAPERLIVARDAQALVGQIITDVLGPQAECIAETVRRCYVDGVEQVTRYPLSFDGRSVWLEGRAVPLGERVMWIARDITEMLRAEQELTEARQALEHAAALAQVGAWTLDLETGQLFWSSSMCRLAGMAEQSFAAPLVDVISRFGQPEDSARFKLAVESAVESGGQVKAPMRFRRADGALRHARMIGDVRRDATGRPTHVYGMTQDVTEQVEQAEQQRALEAHLAQSSKMEAIGQLAGGVAHDFNNLLTTISGYTEFLLDDLPQDSTQREDLEEIHRAAQRAASLTRQLLSFSRRSLIKPVVIDLNDLARDMERMLRRLIGEHIEMTVVASEEPLHLVADPGQIEQIMMNLVVNAKDAMPRGGRLNVTTQAAVLTRDDLGLLSDAEPGSFVAITVSDTGCGMSEAVMARIFEPFYTTKPVGEGTGLGLSTVYGAVRQNRGHITCRSAVGEGTSFTVYLPRQAETGLSHQPATLEPLGGDETVLLVEDDPAVRGFVERCLRGAGYHVMVAESGDQALAAATGRPLDLLVTDVIMPGMNGKDLAERLADRPDGLRTLFISGYTASVLARQGLASGETPLLVKPFNRDELLQRVRVALDA